MPYSRMRRRLLRGALMSMAVVGIAGCAVVPGGDADRQALLERASAYWAAVQANDLPKAWSYEAASKTGSMTFEAYLKRGGITFNLVQVQAVQDVEGDVARVGVTQRFDVPALRIKNQQVEINDLWQRLDGTWYHASKADPLFKRQ